jgi:hypothetical protein
MDGEPGGTSGSIHGLGYLFSALRREGLIADELVLQLATFLRSLDLFLELSQPIRFSVAASRAQMAPSFRAFIPVPNIHDRYFSRRRLHCTTITFGYNFGKGGLTDFRVGARALAAMRWPSHSG